MSMHENTFVNDQTDFRVSRSGHTGNVMLVNIFTPKPGQMEAFIAAQTSEYKRLLGTVPGWIGNRLGLSFDGKKAVNVAVFESRKAYETWRDSAAFSDHLKRIQPYVAESAPGIYQPVYAAGEIP
jgi:heme-degrading monooxygenase HmoA